MPTTRSKEVQEIFKTQPNFELAHELPHAKVLMMVQSTVQKRKSSV